MRFPLEQLVREMYKDARGLKQVSVGHNRVACFHHHKPIMPIERDGYMASPLMFDIPEVCLEPLYFGTRNRPTLIGFVGVCRECGTVYFAAAEEAPKGKRPCTILIDDVYIRRLPPEDWGCLLKQLNAVGIVKVEDEIGRTRYYLEDVLESLCVPFEIVEVKG